MLGKGARITGGAICLLFALHTWLWVMRDVVELGPGDGWKLWTGALARGADQLTQMPATTSADLGLGLLQLAAAFAAFTGAWAAGGLLASATALTFAYRLPVIWQAALHSDSEPFYALRGFGGDESLDVAAGTSVVAVLFCLVLATVLLTGNGPWPRTPTPPAGPPGWPGPVPGHPQPYGAPPQPGQLPGQPPMPPQPPQPEPPLPSESPQRPTGAHAAVAALFLGALLVFNIAWNIHSVLTTGGGTWLRLFTGEGVAFSLLQVPPALNWLTLIVLCGAGAILALTRGISARGFTLGLAIAVLPTTVTALWGYLDAGVFFELGGAAPFMSFFSRLHVVVTLLGAVALVVLSLRPGVPAEPGAAPAGGPAPFGAPFGAPQQPQPYFQPQPHTPAQPSAAPQAPHAPPPPNFPPQPGQPGQAGGPYGAPPAPAGPPPTASPPPAQPPNSGPAYGYPPPPENPGPPGGAFGPPPS